MEYIETKCKITALNYFSTSYYGNPKYEVWFSTEDESFYGKTVNNAMCAYAIRNYLNRECRIKYHYTAKGNLVIDYVNDVN